MKKFIIILATLAVAIPVLAKPEDKSTDFGEKMQSVKIGYLTSEMDLTPEEAQVFWPVYNQAEAEIQQSFKEVFKAQKAIMDALDAGKGDADYKKLTAAYIKACAQRDEITQKYFEKFAKVLSPEKLARYYMAEEKFRRDQIRQLQGGPKNGPQQGKEGPRQGQRPQQGRPGAPGEAR